MRQIVFAIIFWSASLVYGATAIMPVKDIRPGMRGVGFTIFENNQIEPFDVEIIDIVHNFFPQQDLILIRLLGDRVSHTGVVAGMSGSPIYIDNKLIGALAYRIGTFMKDAIAGVTPIEQMLEIFTKEKARRQEIITATSSLSTLVKDYFNNHHFEQFDLVNLLNWHQQPNFQTIKSIETPLVMTGLFPSVFEKINARFQESNFVLLPGGKLPQAGESRAEALQPGSAIAGTIVSGDFDISAVGTVTYRDGDKILAFGHAFFNSGPVNIPMSGAQIITTLSSLYASNKFAVATKIIGNIRQDRSTGIMGQIGEMPPTIPIQVKINSPVTLEKHYQFNIVTDRSTSTIVPTFLWITLLNTLESARLAFGDYALQLKGRIGLENAHDVILDNFYAGGDAGTFDGSGLDISEAAFDVVMTLGALLVNEFEIPKIRGVDLEFYAQPGQKLAEIEKVFYDKEELNPGDSLNIVVVLRPYQGKRLELNKRIPIPKNLSDNSIIIAVGGHNSITKWENQAGIGKFSPTNLNELVSLLNRRRKNTDIIIQLKTMDQGAMLHGREFPTLPPSIYQILTDKKTDKTYEPIKEKIIKEWIIPIEYDVRGGRQFNLKLKQY